MVTTSLSLIYMGDDQYNVICTSANASACATAFVFYPEDGAIGFNFRVLFRAWYTVFYFISHDGYYSYDNQVYRSINYQRDDNCNYVEGLNRWWQDRAGFTFRLSAVRLYSWGLIGARSVSSRVGCVLYLLYLCGGGKRRCGCNGG